MDWYQSSPSSGLLDPRTYLDIDSMRRQSLMPGRTKPHLLGPERVLTRP